MWYMVLVGSVPKIRYIYGSSIVYRLHHNTAFRKDGDISHTNEYHKIDVIESFGYVLLYRLYEKTRIRTNNTR